jgi:hypothetical protein
VSCSAYSSTLKIEATCSSKSLVYFQRTTRRYIPENTTLYDHRCKKLKSYILSRKPVKFRIKCNTVLPVSAFLAIDCLASYNEWLIWHVHCAPKLVLNNDVGIALIEVHHDGLLKYSCLAGLVEFQYWPNITSSSTTHTTNSTKQGGTQWNYLWTIVSPCAVIFTVQSHARLISIWLLDANSQKQVTAVKRILFPIFEASMTWMLHKDERTIH